MLEEIDSIDLYMYKSTLWTSKLSLNRFLTTRDYSKTFKEFFLILYYFLLLYKLLKSKYFHSKFWHISYFWPNTSMINLTKSNNAFWHININSLLDAQVNCNFFIFKFFYHQITLIIQVVIYSKFQIIIFSCLI